MCAPEIPDEASIYQPPGRSHWLDGRGVRSRGRFLRRPPAGIRSISPTVSPSSALAWMRLLPPRPERPRGSRCGGCGPVWCRFTSSDAVRSTALPSRARAESRSSVAALSPPAPYVGPATAVAVGPSGGRIASRGQSGAVCDYELYAPPDQPENRLSPATRNGNRSYTSRHSTADWRRRFGRESRLGAGATIDIVQEERRSVFEGSPRRPDILIDGPVSPPVVIEASYGAADAERDARGRLGQTLRAGGAKVRAGVAVWIPGHVQRLRSVEDVTAWLLQGNRIQYVLLQGESDRDSPRWPLSGWTAGSADDLVAVLPAICQSSLYVAALAEGVAMHVRHCADRLAARISPYDMTRSRSLAACGSGCRGEA